MHLYEAGDRTRITRVYGRAGGSPLQVGKLGRRKGELE